MSQTLSTPDFDCYPLTRTLSSARVADGDVEVRYMWWLRNPMAGETATIKAFYPAFMRFQRLANDPGNQRRLVERATS